MYKDTQSNLLICFLILPFFSSLCSLTCGTQGFFTFIFFQKIIVDKCALVCYNINTAQQYGHLAQLVEHPLDVRKVSGSRPLVSTRTNTLKPVWFRGVCCLYENLRQDSVKCTIYAICSPLDSRNARIYCSFPPCFANCFGVIPKVRRNTRSKYPTLSNPTEIAMSDTVLCENNSNSFARFSR